MPTTTTGLATSFITFSRPGATGGGATVTDQDGRIKWAGHNLLLASESFDSSSWTKTTTTVAANSHAAPNSTTTAETLTASSANGTTLQSYTALAVPYTFGVWLKRKTGTGNIQIAADSGTYTTVTITSDWALYTVTQTPAAGTISAGIRIVTSGDEVYAWGTHLYRSDLGGMQQNPAMGAGMGSYYPTTPRNLLGYTEAISSWTAIGTPTITANTDIAPNGLQTADTVSDTNASGYQGVRLTYPSVNGGVYTGSIHIKKTGATSYPVFQVYKDSTNTACGLIVNVAAGTVAVISGAGYAAPDAYNIVSVGDYWRVWIRVTATSTGSAGFDFYPAGSTDGTTISSSATGSAIIWGAQLSDSASLDTYVPQYGAAVTSAAYYAPRLDFDGATLSPKGLLVEEQRVNLLLRSNEFDTSANWITLNSTVSANAIASPDGTTNADKIVEDTATGSHIVYQGVSLAANTTYALSVYAKAHERTKINLFTNAASVTAANLFDATFDLSVGTASAAQGTATITNIGGGWYRCTVTNTMGGTGGSANIQFRMDNGSGTSYAGSTGSGLYVYGAQLEAGSFATSYIPNGSAVAGATRTADVASVSTQAFPYSASEGTLVVNAVATLDSGVFVQMDDGTQNNRIIARAVGGSTALQYIISGGTEKTLSVGTFASGTTVKVAIAAKLNDSAASANGGTVATETSVNMPAAATTLRLGADAAGAYSSTWIRQVTYLPRRLTNAELQQRTQ